ncbi:MAG: GntR family transcriptional regulator [Clostridia bacterium]|nr:GntR family transcriptional regulator [Clostridia bacterium]
MQKNDAGYIVAYEYLKNNIVNNKYDDDYVFVEAEIAAELGMSRTPVREAISMLRSEKLLMRVPKKGIVCREMQKGEIKSVYEMAEALEGMMAYNVARHHTAQQLETMLACVEKMEQAFRNGDEKTWAEGDIAFHACLRDFCGNTFLQEAMENINVFISILRNRYTLLDAGSRERSTVQHREMYEAICAGDADYARTLVQYHFRVNRRRLSQV